VRLLLKHPGVGRIVALAFALTVGSVDRFPSSKQLVSYLGLNPSEHSSGGPRDLARLFATPEHTQSRLALEHSVRTATPTLDHVFGKDAWALASESPEFKGAFNAP